MKPDKAREIPPPRRFYFYLQSLFLKLGFWVVTGLSEAAVSSFAEMTGSLLFMRRRRREFSINNLRRAFPEKPQEEIEKIGRESMQNLVRVILEFIRIPLIAKNPGGFIEIRGEENVRQALRQGRGLILAVSHFGNWELAGIAASAQGMPLYAVGKTYKNPLVNETMRRLRGMTGLQTINQKGAVRESIQLIKKNKVIAMLIDEHAKKGAVWVDLFGRQAATSALPAMLALKYHTPVLAVFFYREKDKRSVLVFEGPFPLIETGDYDSDIAANTRQYMARLEKELIKRPADWTLWMHNRWRREDQLRVKNEE